MQRCHLALTTSLLILTMEADTTTMKNAGSPDPIEEFIDACVLDPERARRVVQRSPSIVASTFRGEPILHWLVIEDFASAVELLLSLGAEVDSRDLAGATALGRACMAGRLGCARILLRHGADPNASDPFGDCVLNVAARHEHTDIVELLLDSGARADYVPPSYDTIFRSMQSWPPDTRATFVEKLESLGVTREGLFRNSGLREAYESPEQAYGW